MLYTCVKFALSNSSSNKNKYICVNLTVISEVSSEVSSEDTQVKIVIIWAILVSISCFKLLIPTMSKNENGMTMARPTIAFLLLFFYFSNLSIR